MARIDRSRPSRIAFAMVGTVIAAIFGFIAGLRPGAAWLGLILALGFALALLLEIAGGWEETSRPYRRRALQAFWLILGLIILGVVTYREGWELTLFLLIFLAIWHVASIEPHSEY
jgi:drug/metabolite transporter superfamily protein YnfA